MKVGGVQPDLVADLVVVGCHLLFVILSLHIGRSLLKRVLRLSMNVAHRRHEFLCCWIGDGIVIRGIGDETRVLSVQHHERVLASSAVDPVVVRKLCEWEPIGPVVLSIVNEDLEVFLDLLVNSFGLTICLRMESGRCVGRDVEESVEFLHEFGDELRASIQDDDLQHAVLGIDVIS